jgi:hypothetical protein
MKNVKLFEEFLNENMPMTVKTVIELAKGKKFDEKSLGVFLFDHWKTITGKELGSMDFPEKEESFIADVIGYYHLDGEEVMKSMYDYAKACNEKNNEEEIKEDFAAVGTPPAGNVSGMGAVIAPTPGSIGSGDTWQSLGAPSVSLPLNTGFCAKCKKPKKACRCEDSPSQKIRKKHNKIRESNMKHIPAYDNFIDEAITVNKGAREQTVKAETEYVKQQIIDAGKRGQEYVILHFDGPDYAMGYDVMDNFTENGAGMVSVQERGFGTTKTHDGYMFNISCVITDKSLIDQKSKDSAVGEAINRVTKQAEAAAAKGSDQVVLRFDAPTLGDGDRVMDAMRKEGLSCNERGFKSTKKHDGSYEFAISCTIGG